MKKIIFTIWLCSTLLIANYSLLIAQTGWFQQNSGTGQSFATVFFLNSQTGFAGGGFKIYKTTNSGANWTEKILSDTMELTSIRFLNNSTGYACGGRNVNQYYSYQYLFKTTNSGETWLKILQYTGSLTSEYFNDVFPIDTLVYLTKGGTTSMSNIGSMYLSQNSGVSFSMLFLTGEDIQRLSFVNSQTGWLTSTWGSDVPPGKRKIYKTTNHGQNWTVQFRDTANTGNFAVGEIHIQFLNLNTGYSMYYRNSNFIKFLKTTNGGSTWDSSLIPYGKYKSMFFADASTGWICGGFYPDSVMIIRTTNSGANWHVQKKGNLSLNAIYFVNNLTGWAVGYSGIILKTTTGGVTGIQNISSEIPSSYSLEQNYPNPFNPTTKIKFDVVRLGDVKIVVYDVMGREVQTLVNERLHPGTYEVTFDASMLTSGIYFYRLETTDFVQTNKMILLK